MKPSAFPLTHSVEIAGTSHQGNDRQVAPAGMFFFSFNPSLSSAWRPFIAGTGKSSLWGKYWKLQGFIHFQRGTVKKRWGESGGGVWRTASKRPEGTPLRARVPSGKHRWTRSLAGRLRGRLPVAVSPRRSAETPSTSDGPTGPKRELPGRRFDSRAARDKGGRRVANGGPCPEFAPERPPQELAPPVGSVTARGYGEHGRKKNGPQGGPFGRLAGQQRDPLMCSSRGSAGSPPVVPAKWSS